MGTALYMLLANLQKDLTVTAHATAQVVRADGLFTGLSGIIQPLTGFAMIYLKGHALDSFWVWGSIVGYAIAGLCWLPVVYLQIQCRNIAFATLAQQKNLPKFIIVI